jgi:hypothetical protein
MPPDHGLELVEHVRAVLGVDAVFATDEPAGFRWWPWRLPQRVWAERHAEGARVRAIVETLVARGVPGTGDTYAALSDAFVRDPGLSAPRWNAETGELTLRASVTLAGEPDRLNYGRAAAMLAHAALLQLGDAERLASLAATLGAEPARGAPPGRPPRSEPDALLEAGDAYAMRGAGASPWTREVFESFATLASPPWSRALVAGGVFDAEFRALAGGSPAEAAASTSLLRMTGAERHPRLGAGLLVMLLPPPAAEPEATRRHATAALLNEAEAREWLPAEPPWAADALGAWCVHPQHGLAHVLFLPRLADRPDLLEAVVRGAALRARWVPEFLARVAARRTAGGTPAV